MIVLESNELGSQDLQEFEELLQAYVLLRPRKFIEIGSMFGWSLLHFVHYAQDGAIGLAIDLPIGWGDHRAARQDRYSKHVWPQYAADHNCALHVIRDASQKAETLSRTKEIFGQDDVDFLFIDGDHSYDAVKDDFEMYAPLVRPGGLVALHDIAVHAFGGCQQLWDEIKDTGASYREIFHDPNDKMGIGLFYV